MEARNRSKCSSGMSQRRIVSRTAGSSSSSVSPRQNASDQAASRSARSAGGAALPRSSTISSAYRANPYNACTYGRFAGGSSSVDR